MYLPHLYRSVGSLIVGGIVLLMVSLIFSNILIPHHGALRGHPWLQRFVGASPLLFPALCWALFSLAAHHDRRVERELAVSGASALATVTAVRDLGVDVETSRMLLLELQVKPVDGAPFDASMGVMPSRLVADDFEPGTDLRVRYDPKDHSRLMVEP